MLKVKALIVCDKWQCTNSVEVWTEVHQKEILGCDFVDDLLIVDWPEGWGIVPYVGYCCPEHNKK